MKPRNYYAKAVTRIPQKIEKNKKKYTRKAKHNVKYSSSKDS